MQRAFRLCILISICLTSVVVDCITQTLATSSLHVEQETETNDTIHTLTNHRVLANETPKHEDETPWGHEEDTVTALRKDIVKGLKRVALFGIHFEGNLGDLMETTPLILKLHEWGVEIDCYLSMFRQGGGIMDRKIKKGIGRFCSNFFVDKIMRFEVTNRNYDTIIIAPGPTVNHFKYCFADYESPNQNISLVWFGVSVAMIDELIFEKQQSCLSLIAVREPVSLKLVKAWRAELPFSKESQMYREAHSILSGDLSFSYQPISDDVQHYTNVYQKLLRPLLTSSAQKNQWVLIFSRKNNFGPDKGVWISQNSAHIRTIDGQVKEYDMENVVFASSSDLEDHEHMNRLKQEFLVPHDRVNTCHSIEEMFALISLAPEVVTDRYHPGVSALIQGTKLTITNYPNEEIKMKGLFMMSKHTKAEIKQMNDNAFNHLLNIIQSRRRRS